MRRSLFTILCMLLLCGCYNQGPITPDAWNLTEQQLDSISFYTTHHYTQGYNFVVSRDSLKILEQQNEMMPVPDILTAEITAGDETMPMLSLVDSITLRRHDHLVVADIHTVPSDSIDSVWVKVARDQLTFGWVRESELLAAVSPDDPISQFIDFFSDSHLLIFLAFCVLVGGAYGVSHLLRKGQRSYISTISPRFIPRCSVCWWQHRRCFTVASNSLRLRCGGISITTHHSIPLRCLGTSDCLLYSCGRF